MELLGASALWIWELVLELVAWLFPEAQPGTAWSIGRPVLLALLALVALAGLARATAWGMDRLISDSGGRRNGADDSEELDTVDWERRARAAAVDGRWRDAAMALYQAVLHRLADQGHLRLEPSKTPGDYRREVRGGPAVVGRMATFIRTFETVAFGAAEPDEEAYRSLEARAAPLGTRA